MSSTDAYSLFELSIERIKFASVAMMNFLMSHIRYPTCIHNNSSLSSNLEFDTP